MYDNPHLDCNETFPYILLGSTSITKKALGSYEGKIGMILTYRNVCFHGNHYNPLGKYVKIWTIGEKMCHHINQP